MDDGAGLAYDVSSTTDERAVLACCLLSPMARGAAREMLTSTDFYHPVHELIWDTINRLDAQGLPVSGPSVATVLQQSGEHQRQVAIRLVVDLGGYPVAPGDAAFHAEQVRRYAQKRLALAEAERFRQLLQSPGVDTLGLVAGMMTRLATIRDAGVDTRSLIESVTVEELLLEVDEEPDWVVPGFLERADRFVLTGEEGLGKSYLLRQIAVLAAAGLHPLTLQQMDPVKTMVVDFENTRRQIRRKLGSIYGYAARHGRGAPGEVGVLALPRSDITSDKVLSMIHRELDHRQPDILVIGPLYKMSPQALKTDDEAGPVLAALDTIRQRDIAMLIEAHAGNENGAKHREWRPRGSAALRGWPEFGYGLKATGAKSAVLIPWRGDRDVRDFPTGLVQQDGLWVEEKPLLVHEVWRQQDWSDLAFQDDDRD